MAFKASPSSQHQHCTDEAQKAETVLSAVSYIYIYIDRCIYIYIYIQTKQSDNRGGEGANENARKLLNEF